MSLATQISQLASRVAGEFKLIRQQMNDLAAVPTGAVSAYAGPLPAPTGWLVCSGQAVNRSAYPALFAVIGTTYGTGSGVTQFNLPNLESRIPVGMDSAQTEFNALGKVGGAKTHTLTVAETPAHTHGPGANSNGFFVHATGGSGFNAAFPSTGGEAGFYRLPQETGGGGAHNNLQPYMVLNYIIKA